jgi:hypothetical protein
MKVEIKGKQLVITMDMDENRTLSASGKTKRIASTCGNVKTGVMVDSKELVIGVNAYIPVN